MMAVIRIGRGSLSGLQSAAALLQARAFGCVAFQPGSLARKNFYPGDGMGLLSLRGMTRVGIDLQHGIVSSTQLQVLGQQFATAAEIADNFTVWQEKTDFLLSCGLSREQAVRVLRRNPLLLSLSVEEELQPKVSFLKSLGVSNLAKVVRISPNVLLCKTGSTLVPKVVFFESLGIQRQSIGKIIERYPTVLTYSVESNMRSKIKFLESIGLEKENVARVVMRSPYIFALSVNDNMKLKVELLESIGVDKKLISKLITRCPKIFCLSNEENIMPKIRYLESVGVLKESMGKLVATCPSILNLSMTHIQKKLDFLEDNNYTVEKVINVFPAYLTYSLEHRIEPRHKVMSCLKELGLLQREYSLSSILQISQRQFVKDFVQSHPQGDILYLGS